jgi:hypothetical protein
LNKLQLFYAEFGLNMIFVSRQKSPLIQMQHKMIKTTKFAEYAVSASDLQFVVLHFGLKHIQKTQKYYFYIPNIKLCLFS